MRLIEYGTENPNVILLLHGGGLSWWNYREEAIRLQDRYHIVLPILDGHTQSDAPFTTIEDNAKELIGYIDAHFAGSVLAIGGLSLGGQILVEMLSQRGSLCRFALIESALVIPMPRTAAWIAPAVALSYGLIKKKWFSKMQFQALKMRENLFADYYRDSCQIRKEDMIRFLQSNSSYALKPTLSDTTAAAALLVGRKEQGALLRSAELLHARIPGSQLQMPDYFHGELSLNHPDEYVDILVRLISGTDKVHKKDE